MDANELRTSIIQSLIKALLGVQNAEETERARSLVDLLENEIGDRLIVFLLRLELLSATEAEVFDSTSYCDILQRIIRTAMLSEGNFKMIMFHVRKLNNKSPSMACKALDEFMNLRVLKQEKDEWIEKVLITRLWMATEQRESQESLILLQDLLSVISDNLIKPVSPAATLAAHTVSSKFSSSQEER